MSDAFLDETLSPVLLTARATVAFLPAWLLRALHHLPGQHAIVPELVVYSLCPYKIDKIDDDNEDQIVASAQAVSKLTATADMMTAEQIGAVRAFLEYVQRRSPDAELLRRFIEPALETVWKL